MADVLFIQDVNGKLWTASDWDNSVIPNGVAIKVGEGYCVVALNSLGNFRISYDQKFEAPDMPICVPASNAILDMDGYANTELMAAFYGTSTTYAVGACVNHTFPNGEKGYLPSAGEVSALISNLDYANELIALCGGTQITSEVILTSTRGQNFSNGQVSYWFWMKSNGWTNWAGIDGSFGVRPFSKFVTRKEFTWDDGGNLYVSYKGERNGVATFSADLDEGIDREKSVSFIDKSRSVIVERTVRQQGLREVFNASDGAFILADGGTFNVLKNEL